MLTLLRLASLAALVSVSGQTQPAPPLRSGDVVFISSASSRSALIQKATKSPWSHVGVVEVTPAGTFVIEAVQPVRRVPLEVFRGHSRGGRLLVRRHRALSADAQAKVLMAASRFIGRPYDARYRWDDERLYCSELVVKAFAAAGLAVGHFQRVDALAVSPQELRYAASMGVPASLELVTPASVAADNAFVTVVER